MAASLQGGLEHAKAWAMSHEEAKVALVYVTDGEPEGCPDDDMTASLGLIGAAYVNMPSVPTFVLGVGPNLDNLDRLAAVGAPREPTARMAAPRPAWS